MIHKMQNYQRKNTRYFQCPLFKRKHITSIPSLAAITYLHQNRFVSLLVVPGLSLPSTSQASFLKVILLHYYSYYLHFLSYHPHSSNGSSLLFFHPHCSINLLSTESPMTSVLPTQARFLPLILFDLSTVLILFTRPP